MTPTDDRNNPSETISLRLPALGERGGNLEVGVRGDAVLLRIVNFDTGEQEELLFSRKNILYLARELSRMADG